MDKVDQYINHKEDTYIEGMEKLNGRQKAAIFLISMGVKSASKVLKELKEIEVEQLTRAIAELDNVSPDLVDKIREEFYEMMQARKYVVEGGKEYAYNLLAESIGETKADEMLKKYEYEEGTDAFGIFQSADMNQIVNFLEGENPQVAAVILAHLKTRKAADILGNLSENFQGQITARLARMGKISSEVVEELEMVIRNQMKTDYKEPENVQKGTAAVASILNESSIATERNVIQSIEKLDSDLAQEIKDQMFLFEDIVDLDDRTVQTIISKLDKQDMVIGLKGIADDLKNKFLNNMSNRARDILVDDMEAFGPVHLNKVEEAQQNIVRTIKNLDQEGKVSMHKEGDDSFVE